MIFFFSDGANRERMSFNFLWLAPSYITIFLIRSYTCLVDVWFYPKKHYLHTFQLRGKFHGWEKSFLLFQSTIEVVDIHPKQKIKKATKADVLVNLYFFCKIFILCLLVFSW